MYITFPLMLGLAVVAEPLFIILLGEQWRSSVLYFQLLCFVGMLYPLHAINLNILKVAGRSDLFLRLEIFKKTIYTVMLFLFFSLGILGLIYALICSSILSYFLNSFYSNRFGGYSMKEQVKDIYPFLLYTVIMLSIIFLFDNLFSVYFDLFLKLLTNVLFGSIIYLVLCKVFSSKDFTEFIRILKDFYKQALIFKDKLSNEKISSLEE